MLPSEFIWTESRVNEIKIWLILDCGIIKSALESLVLQILQGRLCRQVSHMSCKRPWGLRLFQVILGLLYFSLETMSFSSGNWILNDASQMN